MRRSARSFTKVVAWLAAGICLFAAVAALITSSAARQSKPVVAAAPRVTSLELVPGTTDTLALSESLIQTLGVRTAKIEPARAHTRLSLAGSLFLDSNRMVHVHSRFAGEVVSIGLADHADEHSSAPRPLRLGDHVEKGQLLAVIWSKEVGEKKSDLINALSKQYLDDAQLQSLKALGKDIVAARQIREAERERESDVIEVTRVERTLRSWRLSEEEIATVRAEAEKIHRGEDAVNVDMDKRWAEIEVRSPFDGVILEKNIVSGDIVNTDLDLFVVADLSVLGVMANVYEEDLPALEQLAPDQRAWTVYLKSWPDSPGLAGTFSLIGNIVDPNQHTAAVMGWLDNADGKLRAGQFVTAVVELPDNAQEVAVPDSAVVEGPLYGTVFIATDARSSQVTRRHVAVVGRGNGVVYIRCTPCAEDAAQGCCTLIPGEWVVTAGTIELDGALESALATAPPHEPSIP